MNNLEAFAQCVAEDIRELKEKSRDTGWRKVTSTSLENSHVLVRRIGTMCYVSIGGGRWDTFTIAPSQRGVEKIRVLQLPTGFRTKAAILGSITKDGNSIVGQMMLTSERDGSWLQFKSVPVDMFELLRPYMLIYPTHDLFPTTLLGVAA